MRIFIKVQERKYIEDMYENEYLYFSSLYGFRDDQDETGRPDPKEGNLINRQIDYLAVGKGQDKIILSEVLTNFNSQYHEFLAEPQVSCCPLFFQNLRVNKVLRNFDDRILALGDSALVIYEEKKFYDFLDQSIKHAGYEYSRGFVKYYDPTKHDGDLTLHHKNEEFKFQNEYRIIIAPTKEDGIKIPIDNLQEISFIIDSNQIQDLRLISNS